MKILYRGKYKKSCGWGFGFALEILSQEYKDYECTLIIEEDGEVMANVNDIGDKDNLISGDPEKSYKAEWPNPELSTLSRQRTLLMKKKDLTEDYKKFLSCMMDIAHEVGHQKYHVKDGKSQVDYERYRGDLEYRLQIEAEAEREVTRVAKKYGFYSLINDTSWI